jgi:hypothetical protein
MIAAWTARPIPKGPTNDQCHTYTVTGTLHRHKGEQRHRLAGTEAEEYWKIITYMDKFVDLHIGDSRATQPECQKGGVGQPRRQRDSQADRDSPSVGIWMASRAPVVLLMPRL